MHGTWYRKLPLKLINTEEELMKSVQKLNEAETNAVDMNRNYWTK